VAVSGEDDRPSFGDIGVGDLPQLRLVPVRAARAPVVLLDLHAERHAGDRAGHNGLPDRFDDWVVEEITLDVVTAAGAVEDVVLANRYGAGPWVLAVVELHHREP